MVKEGYKPTDKENKDAEESMSWEQAQQSAYREKQLGKAKRLEKEGYGTFSPDLSGFDKIDNFKDKKELRSFIIDELHRYSMRQQELHPRITNSFVIAKNYYWNEETGDLFVASPSRSQDPNPMYGTEGTLQIKAVGIGLRHVTASMGVGDDPEKEAFIYFSDTGFLITPDSLK